MKDFSQKVLPIGLALSIFASACGTVNFSKNNYSVTPNPLELKGDSVLVTISGTIPEKSMKAKAIVGFQPYLKTAEGKEIPLKAIKLKGEKAEGSADFTINSKTGGSVTYTDKIAYTSDLKNVKLLPKFTFEDKVLPVPDSIMVLGTITTANLVQYNNETQISEDVYQQELNPKSVSIYFPMDVEKFNLNYKAGKNLNNKTQIAELKNLLKKDPNWIVKGISINAFASPDGELSRNNNLSSGRSASTFAYFRKELKKLGFSEVNDSNFSMGYMLAEDWKGFGEMLATSNLADKDAMLQIINNKGISDEERESLLRRNHVVSWKYAADNFLPKLRRSELLVIGGKPFKDDATLMNFYGKYAELSQMELYHLSRITTDLTKKEEVLNAYNTYFSSDWRGFNDLALLNYAQNKNVEAISNLEKAAAIAPNNGVVLVNLSALARMQGNLAKANEYLAKAESNGANTSLNKGLMDIKRGNYSSAVSNLTKSGKSPYNLALAQILNGDANGAKNTIDKVNPDDLTWKHYYVRAIAGARMNNQDVCTTNLAKAVQLSNDARNMAKEDLEFRNFFNNALFQAAIR
jgi:tetratricopeptide (TPR) repeat protein